MSKKNFFFTNTSIFPARLVETTGSRNSNSLPPIAALDPLMAGSSFQPDPAFAPSEQEVQSQIDAINTRFDNQLNEVSDFIAEEYRAIDAGERTRQDGTADRTQLIRYINDRSTLQASQQEEILNAPADLVSNDFEWLRNKRFNLRTLKRKIIFITEEQDSVGRKATQSSQLWFKVCCQSMQLDEMLKMMETDVPEQTSLGSIRQGHGGKFFLLRNLWICLIEQLSLVV